MSFQTGNSGTCSSGTDRCGVRKRELKQPSVGALSRL